MASPPQYGVVVVGGGPAGLTAGLYATRLGHRTAVVSREGGRYSTVRHVHNLVGVSEDTTGADVSRLGVEQLLEYGADYYERDVAAVEPTGEPVDSGPGTPGPGDGEPRFVVHAGGDDLATDRLVLATGFSDEPPRVPGLREFTGSGLYYCLHCDAYVLGDEQAFVLGHDDHAASVAMMLLNVTGDVDLLLDGEDPAWGDDVARQVEAHPLDVRETPVDHAYEADPDDHHSDTHVTRPERRRDDAEEPRLGGLEFADGTRREYAGGFAVYGQRYHNDLARDLGCDLEDDGAVAVDDRQETSVDGVYAAGDVTHGQNQTTVALGDGARAGIAVHKDLRPFPAAPDAETLPDAPAAPADLRARMALVRQATDHAGMVPPDRRD